MNESLSLQSAIALFRILPNEDLKLRLLFSLATHNNINEIEDEVLHLIKWDKLST